MKTSLQQLTEKLKEGKVIPVIGAGVSQAAANLPGWKGLIESGLSYAEDRRLGLDSLGEIKEALLYNDLTKAALILKNVLNAPSSPFSIWLEEVFGSITYSSKDLLKSIEELGCPIVLTTNYDTLLSSFSPIMPKKILDWTQHEEILRALRKKDEFILHLHGIYEKPQTLIFGSDDYKKLESELGYKEVLGQLWSSYHFLFIGCSKDGVMDDDFITSIDFMNKWFPGYPHQHFILLNERDFSSNIHEVLLKKCRIEAVSYGQDRALLPNFIKQLDADKIKFKEKGSKLRSYIDERLENISRNPEEIPELLASVLPSNGQWAESEQVDILDRALFEFNKSITNTRQKFELYQEIIKGLIKVSELEEKVNLWSFGAPVEPSMQGKFIEVAIIAFNTLNRIPVELMQEIRRRKFSHVHEYYFSGYLSRFIKEYNSLKEAGIDVVEFYKDDEYFFENLKRIIDSLKNLLELKPDEVFEELDPPIACNNLPKEFIAYNVGSNIFIVAKNNLSETIANLPIEKNLPLHGIEWLQINNITYILGYNSKYCFLWNPKSSFAAMQLFSSDMDETIDSILVSKKPLKNTISIITNKKSIVYNDFVYQEKLPQSKYTNFLKMESRTLYIAIKPGDTFYKGPCLFKSSNTIDWEEIYTKQELWESLLEIPEVNRIYEDAKQNNTGTLTDLIGFYSMKVNSVTFNKKPFLVCSLNHAQLFGDEGGTCLFYINLEDFKIFKKIYLSNCHSVILKQIGEGTLLICGHLANSKYRQDVSFKIQISDKSWQVLDLGKTPENIVEFDSDVSSIDILSPDTVIIKLLNNKIISLNHREMTILATYTYDDYLGPLCIC